MLAKPSTAFHLPLAGEVENALAFSGEGTPPKA